MPSTGLTTEQLEIRALAREFAEGELRPHTARWDEERALDDDVFAKLAELGFMGMRVPEQYGGLGLDWTTYLLVVEELGRGDASVALSVAVHGGPVTELLLRHANEAQKERWLPRLASGELLGAFALSEPTAGSDAGAVRTVAEPLAGGWRLGGTKRWVTNGARAGLVAVFARAHAERNGDSGGALGCFFVEPPREGYQAGAREKTMGFRASETVGVTLEGLQVDAADVLGEVGEGLAYALGAVDVGRAGVAALSVGVAQAALEHATRYALEREQFSTPLASFGTIQEKLAVMATRTQASRALALDVARAFEASAGEEGGTDRRALSPLAAMAKLQASETAMWVTDEAVQVFGGYGYMRDYPVEKLMRDAKGTEIFEGTSEILRLVIARDVLAAARAAGS